MRARRGQSGTIVRKGDQWHVRFYADEEKGRKKKSVAVGPAVGKGRLTKAEAARKGAEIVDSAGVNTQAHLTRAEHPESAETLTQRVAWCQRFHRAWTESKPGSLTSMESHLTKHILPRFGELLVEQVTEKPSRSGSLIFGDRRSRGRSRPAPSSRRTSSRESRF
jgi:hypothetical protein